MRANSSAVQAAIVAEAPGLAGRVRMIPNPLPFVPARPPDWAAKTNTILFAGRLHPEKGIELLLEAWSLCRRAHRLDGWRLEFIGPALYIPHSRRRERHLVWPCSRPWRGARCRSSRDACFRDFVSEGRNGFFFDHTLPSRAAALADALERAAGMDTRAIAERAVAVRETHSCASIATRFLEDFARVG